MRAGTYMPTLVGLAALVVGGSVALGAGRGPTAPATAQVPTTTVTVSAGKPSELSFKLSKFSLVPAGNVVFKVTNRGKIVHDFKICTTRSATSARNACVGKVTKRLKPGQSQTLTVKLLKKGKYEFLCTVPGHAGSGMKGLLGIDVRVTAPAVAASSPAPASTATTPAPAGTTPTGTTTTSTTPTAATCSNPRPSTVTVSAFDMGYSVSPSTIPCGLVTFTISNDGDTQHDFQIERVVGAASRLLAPGEKVVMTATVPPGTWTYFCSFPNHRSLGMQGQLTVTG